ncbi:MAG: hypothetical protein KAJ10_07540, partial [Thermodesulfovibrionia bacterium]|nr:hypothetical protein [Thermodesulfovibrionia bacterium]
MKRSFIILLSMMFVLGSFAAVFADDGGMDSVRSAVAGSKVVIGGDAYVEGYWLGNHDLDSDTDADDRFWNQRVRLKIHAAIGSVEVRTRLTTDDKEWNGGLNTGGGSTVACTGDGDGDGDFFGDPENLDLECESSNNGIFVDYAYLHVPIGPVT